MAHCCQPCEVANNGVAAKHSVAGVHECVSGSQPESLALYGV
jgi:hypothetical protein